MGKKRANTSQRLFREVDGQDNLFDKSVEQEVEESKNRPVTCLGMTFENDKARRGYFLEKLKEKLQDQEFRKIEGFPIGTDEAILTLSDPPYYTACPNPWVADFVQEWEKEKPIQNEPYYREPFAADVSEGKNHPIYNAHSYHTKVPHKAIMRYILHYTNPGDIVYDGFCGTGMTGVAAQLCGDRNAVIELGYQVKPNGSILKETKDDQGQSIWTVFSRLGKRKVIMNDLSSAATFISHNFNTPIEIKLLQRDFLRLLSELQSHVGWMWNTIHTDGKTSAKINYVVWSDVYSCSICNKEIVYYDEAFSKKGKITDFNPEFRCPKCDCVLSKNPTKDSRAQKPERIFTTEFDFVLQKSNSVQKQVPILINYSIGSKRYEKRLNAYDYETIKKINDVAFNQSIIPLNKIMEGDKSADPFASGIHYVHQFYTSRILKSLSVLKTLAKGNNQLEFLMGSVLPKLSKMNRYMPQHGGRALVGPMANTLYFPPVCIENNIIDQVSFQIKKILQALSPNTRNVISTQAAQSIKLSESSVDYIFIDPPFGANIMYSELSYAREAWLNVITNNVPEAIENKTQKKDLSMYRHLMTEGFRRAYQFLKPGHWLTVEFSNTKASVWNSIQNALADAGFIVASVASLDKTRGGLHAMLGATAVKQDLVISAYKPNGGFERRFEIEAQTEDGVWDFVRTHLKYLPVFKSQNDIVQILVERDARILFDQMVAYYVRKGIEVPLSSQEFQIGLAQRFIERDGMYFLPEQVAEYDQKKMLICELGQLSIFVSDEATAIQWLRQLLKTKPQPFSDINPQFMQQLGGWNKSEKLLDLRDLLRENFLCFEGIERVPEQIHTYLSSNWKEYRNLPKDNPDLLAKAKDRWYVPDPNKQGDLDMLREKTLLKEFWEYLPAGYKLEKSNHNETYLPNLEPKGKSATFGRKLKIMRIEALRAGFKYCWQNRDYKTIVAVANRIPEDVLQEDPKLLMWYDQAKTRLGEN